MTRPTSLAVLPVLALLALAVPADRAAAQAHDHRGHSAYAGAMEEREIKALDPAEVEGLLAGEGMGLALAAELNGLPGPRHVLELAGELELTPEQRREVEAVHDRMAGEARRLGALVVEAERHLDHMFAAGHASPGAVRDRTAEIGRLRGELRAAHLVAHLETAALLQPTQVEAYRRLRGYGEPPA